MAKFINKKEQVFDLKLTSYGHYLFSIGTFRPTYYAFFDDNVLYDGSYTGLTESQNSIQNRIKNETQYLESLVLFEDVAILALNNKGSIVNFFDVDITPTKQLPRKDTFRFSEAIGNAYLDGKPQNAPAWKMVVLSGEISSSQIKDTVNDLNIPQLNIDLTYTKRVIDSDIDIDPNTIGDLHNKTPQFIDNKIIQLVYDDALIYAEEVNTQLLTENFEIEIFEISSSAVADSGSTPQSTAYVRKYFQQNIPQIKDGYLLHDTPTHKLQGELGTASVEYYFDIVKDGKIPSSVVCRNLEVFTKQSYYIDLDFDCEKERENVFYDIYGQVTEPEICQD